MGAVKGTETLLYHELLLITAMCVLTDGLNVSGFVFSLTAVHIGIGGRGQKSMENYGRDKMEIQ